MALSAKKQRNSVAVNLNADRGQLSAPKNGFDVVAENCLE